MYDVAIIGAGVVGAVTARELSGYKLRICILEKENDVAMGASKANSGIIHAGFDAECGSLKARLNVRGAQLMEDLARELGVKYRRNGALVLGFDEDDRACISALMERGRRNRVQGLRLVEKEELKVLEPNISDDAVCALYAPSSGIICPYELTIAAVGNAMDNGADLKLNFAVEEIKKEGGGYTVTSPGGSIRAKYIINAAGIYADKLARAVGDSSFTIRPRKGEYMILDKSCGGTVSATVFRTPGKMGKGILVSPTVDGNLLLGPTAEEVSDKEDKATHTAELSKVAEGAAQCVKNIHFDRVITSFTGLRAAGDTGDFIINSPIRGFINAAGIESPGLTSAPAIAEYIIGMLQEQGLALKKRQDRIRTREPMHAFHEMSIEDKTRIVKKDPSYGRVVCRCEQITEGEILRALRTHPKARDLDGVKRRCRAQMGRCQGGFCAPYITELLAQELGVDLISVTKSGAGSENLVGKTKAVEI